jgi:Putative phage metallopeptidase
MIMPKLYGSAEQVEEIARSLIPTYHSELASARIKYIHVDTASKQNGKPILGKARKVSGALEYLLETDFIIEVPVDQWNEMDDRKRYALVDHLLEGCTGEEDDTNGDMKWTMRKPDVTEFTSILNRHGAWTDELAGMVEVAQRLNIEARAQEVVESVQTTQEN